MSRVEMLHPQELRRIRIKTAPTPAPAPRQELTTADRMADRTKVKGIYVTGPKAGSTGMEDLIGLVDETELNAMVIDVKTMKEM